MSIRNAVLGLAVVFGASVWAWCRPGGKEAQAQGAEAVVSADTASAGGGTRDDALARYRSNQARHWRQVAIGN